MAITTRTERATGAVRSVGRTVAYSIANASGVPVDLSAAEWVTVCETHSAAAYAPTRRQAAATSTADFCDDCRESADAAARVATISHDVEGARLSVENLPRTFDRRPRYAVRIAIPGAHRYVFTVEGGVDADADTAAGLSSAISFLRAAVESYRASGMAGDNAAMFPEYVNEWADDVSSELGVLAWEADDAAERAADKAEAAAQREAEFYAILDAPGHGEESRGAPVFAPTHTVAKSIVLDGIGNAAPRVISAGEYVAIVSTHTGRAYPGIPEAIAVDAFGNLFPALLQNLAPIESDAERYPGSGALVTHCAGCGEALTYYGPSDEWHTAATTAAEHYVNVCAVSGQRTDGGRHVPMHSPHPDIHAVVIRDGYGRERSRIRAASAERAARAIANASFVDYVLADIRDAADKALRTGYARVGRYGITVSNPTAARVHVGDAR